MYSSLASHAEAGSWGTSSAVIPWLGFEHVSSWKRSCESQSPTQNTASAVLTPFLLDLCLACLQFPCPEKSLFAEFEAVTHY